MSKKLQGNGLWESSRMMLPQHKEAIVQSLIEQERIVRPELDDQEREDIERVLAYSFREHRYIHLQIYGEYELLEMRCIVISVQTYRREVKVAQPGGQTQWIKIEEIIKATE